MNSDTIMGNWNELKAKIKQKWARLTDQDLQSAEGNMEEISARIQKVYGYSKEKAAQEYADFKRDHNL